MDPGLMFECQPEELDSGFRGPLNIGVLLNIVVVVDDDDIGL